MSTMVTLVHQLHASQTLANISLTLTLVTISSLLLFLFLHFANLLTIQPLYSRTVFVLSSDSPNLLC
uniref:Transmembrane protein n=1 Tax=Arabidopsis thaliana TaxID=3702 RepID=Q0WQS6_ARATH|nr:hypothetical protein [Arabidopsis thaliana]